MSDELSSPHNSPQLTQEHELPSSPPPQLHDFLSDLKHAYGVFLRSFALAFGVRYGISSILRIIQILRKGDIGGIFSLNNLFSEKYLIARVDAVRLGLAVGGFGGSYTLLSRIAERIRGKDGFNNFLAGILSGLTLLFLEKDSRRTVSLYVLGRVAEGIYNSLKNHGMWHFWGSHWNHGDTLLFSLASAQIMYAYAMRPETLDETYYKFIVRSGPIAEPVLRAVCATNRGKPIDVESVAAYLADVTPSSIIPLTPSLPIIPCSILHPRQPMCSINAIQVLITSFKKVFPLYATLTFVPTILMDLTRFVKNPIQSIILGTKSSIQSTLFLSTFVAVYMSVVCVQRKIVSRDHRFIYWLAGAISSLAILIEKKSRRAELALYALPRGLDSLYMLLLDRKWMATVPQGEVLLFCLSMGGIMYFYDNEAHTMSPLFVRILDRIVSKNNINLIKLRQQQLQQQQQQEEEEEERRNK